MAHHLASDQEFLASLSLGPRRSRPPAVPTPMHTPTPTPTPSNRPGRATTPRAQWFTLKSGGPKEATEIERLAQMPVPNNYPYLLLYTITMFLGQLSHYPGPESIGTRQLVTLQGTIRQLFDEKTWCTFSKLLQQAKSTIDLSALRKATSSLPAMLAAASSSASSSQLAMSAPATLISPTEPAVRLFSKFPVSSLEELSTAESIWNYLTLAQRQELRRAARLEQEESLDPLLSGEERCHICYEDISPHTIISTFPLDNCRLKHFACAECMRTWTDLTPNCPVCRSTVVGSAGVMMREAKGFGLHGEVDSLKPNKPVELRHRGDGSNAVYEEIFKAANAAEQADDTLHSSEGIRFRWYRNMIAECPEQLLYWIQQLSPYNFLFTMEHLLTFDRMFPDKYDKRSPMFVLREYFGNETEAFWTPLISRKPGCKRQFAWPPPVFLNHTDLPLKIAKDLRSDRVGVRRVKFAHWYDSSGEKHEHWDYVAFNKSLREQAWVSQAAAQIQPDLVAMIEEAAAKSAAFSGEHDVPPPAMLAAASSSANEHTVSPPAMLAAASSSAAGHNVPPPAMLATATASASDLAAALNLQLQRAVAELQQPLDPAPAVSSFPQPVSDGTGCRHQTLWRLHFNHDAAKECQHDEHLGDRRFKDAQDAWHILQCTRCGLMACKRCQRKILPQHSHRPNRQSKARREKFAKWQSEGLA